MLRWFLLLAIALLPLRGWVGVAGVQGPLAHRIAGDSIAMAQAATVARFASADPVPGFTPTIS
jgi:hypothetical protein